MSDTQPPTPASPPQPSPVSKPSRPPSSRIQTQAEVEYRELIEFFKFLVKFLTGFITAVAIIAGILSYKSLKDARTDAVRAARESAEEAVREAISKPNMQELIDRQVQSQVGKKVDDEIGKTLGAKINAFESEQKQISDVAILSSVVRSQTGFGVSLSGPEQLRQLIALMNDSPYKSVRVIARDSLRELAKAYEKNLSRQTNSLGFVANFPDGHALLGCINNPPQNGDILFDCFWDLKKLTRWQVETFDVKAANEWCKSHDCKLNTRTD